MLHLRNLTNRSVQRSCQLKLRKCAGQQATVQGRQWRCLSSAFLSLRQPQSHISSPKTAQYPVSCTKSLHQLAAQKSPYKLVIFDKNGTLIDFHSRWTPWVTALNSRLESATGRDLKDEVYRALDVCHFTNKARSGMLGHGTTWEIKRQLESMLESQGFSTREAQLLVERCWSDYNPADPSMLKPVTDLPELFKNLKDKGMKIAVSTSDTMKNTELILKSLQVEHLVDLVLCCDGLSTGSESNPKFTTPNLQNIFDALGISPSEAVLVGDTPNDMHMAADVGIPLRLGVLTGIGTRLDLHPCADHVIEDISSVQDIIFNKQNSNTQQCVENTSKTKASLVIFDKDGTLISFEKMWTPMVSEFVKRIEDVCGLSLKKEIFEELGFCHKSQRWRPGPMSEGTDSDCQDKIHDLLSSRGIPKERASKIIDETWEYGDHSSEDYLELFDNPRALFKVLKDHGIKVAISTSDSRVPTEQLLRSAGLEQYVDMVVCGDDSDSVPKPSPSNALRICEKLGINPAEVVVVGDTNNDLEMGKLAKLGATVGVLSGVGELKDLEPQADHIVPSVKHVMPIVLTDGQSVFKNEIHGKPSTEQNSTKVHSDNIQYTSLLGSSKGQINRNEGRSYSTCSLHQRRCFSSTAAMKSSSYSYVIVGAGSAGCVLANRLTADGQNSVLLLEAGPKDNTWKISMPAALMYNLCDDKYNWFYHTVPQKHVNDRVMYQPRGRVWGGSSSLNAMAYVRGHPYDYDRWEKQGATGWSYADCLPYFKKAQTHELGPDDYRGGNGPLHVSRGKSGNPLYQAWIDAGMQAGYPFTDDMNGFQQEGVGFMDMTIHKGKRWSASEAYLRPALSRNNLHTVTRALASKIIFDGHRAIGIEYDQGGKTERVYAEKEVILSGGAVNSPQLLMLSGVGDADELKKHDIQVVAHVPGVGQNMQDHLEVYVQQKCTQPVTLFKYQWKYPWNMIPAGVQWFLFKSGVCTSSHLEAGGFIRSRPGVTHPDIQYHFLPSVVIDHGRKMGSCHAYQAHVGPMRSQSTGHIQLKSKNPRDHPLLDFNYLSTEQDLVEMRACIRLTREILAQPAFDPYRGPELTPGPDVQTDKQIDAWVKKMTDTAYHISCTCKMGADDDTMAVVDRECKVRGVDGLRVVDASIMPSVVSGNLNAPTIMIAEKAADIIQGKPPLPQADVPIWKPATFDTQR